ncbi:MULTISPECIES: hypothetical protein [unclassified Pedobacter]|nr:MULTISPECIES: hypothetical protein [unclassified Pedobacter]NII84379.1 hypothetical protein [Pedobacter sp. SG908]NMN38706.1 hypothetical protein [Pedobacter sp. SG918]
MKIFTYDSKRPAIYLSVGLFIFSLIRPAFVFDGGRGLESDQSFIYLLIGGIGLFGGGTAEFLIWLANPFYFIALFLFAKNKKVSILFILISSLLAISFSSWEEILISESGSNGKIVSFSSGYYLWVTSILVLCFGIIYYFGKHRSKID